MKSTLAERKKLREQWINDIPSFREKTDKEHLRFVFEQAEKSLKDSSDMSQILIARTTTLITIMSGLLVGIVAFAIKNWITNKKEDYYEQIILTTIFFGVYVFFICIRLGVSLVGTRYMVAGAEPKDLLLKGYYENSADSDKRMRMFYVSEIINYQERIDENKSLNEKRWYILNLTIWLVICTPVALVLCHLLAEWLI